MPRPKRNLIGERFGRLVVTKEAPSYKTPSGNSRACWYADCDCGTKNKIYLASTLLQGHTKSCGCLRSELLQQIKHNKYDLISYDYGVGWTSNTNKEFYFDKEDYNLIKNYCWAENTYGYIKSTYIDDNKRKAINMHVLIMNNINNCKGKCVDHINHNKYDNRKINLRIVSLSQNSINKKIQSNNKSGIPGVHWSEYEQKWMVTIHINGKQKHYRRKTFEEAVALRKELEEKYYGEDSFDNLQKRAQQYKLKEEEVNNG